MKYSLIIPVFNRPDEVEELLASLERQTFRDFEVIIVEDGSSRPCKDVVDAHPSLPVRYFFKENSGPGQSRNYGADRARGEYLIVLDSDCIIPEGYLSAVDAELAAHPCDAFGGPDAAHSSFSDVQKAINYSMTSFFTTGGIRGGRKQMEKFHPRSFNMGMKASVWKALGGFSKMRFGEDIDLSIRIFAGGYDCRLFPSAWVYHKRRTDLRKFWRQVYNSGIARINLYKKYPKSLKLVHLLPAVFTAGCLFLVLLFFVLLPFVGWWSFLAFVPIALYKLLLFLDSLRLNKSFNVARLSLLAAFVQLFGYGCGFFDAFWRRCILGKDEFSAYSRNFYK